jgi:hypothetical protein
MSRKDFSRREFLFSIGKVTLAVGATSVVARLLPGCKEGSSDPYRCLLFDFYHDRYYDWYAYRYVTLNYNYYYCESPDTSMDYCDPVDSYHLEYYYGERFKDKHFFCVKTERIE